jgi:hypothetical protein
MLYSLTIFKSIYDNKTHRRMTMATWEEFENLLYKLSKAPGYKPKKDERFHPKASPLISPAIFNPGDTRKNVNVQHWGGWAALDVDEYSNGFDNALQTFKDYKFICYSSASSTKEKPKFRVVLPLTRTVQRDDIRHFWFSLSKEFNSLGDEQTKDLSRMYYVPAQYPDAYNFIVSNNSSPVLDVDVLLEKYAYAKDRSPQTFISALPEEIRKQVSDYRQAKLTNTNFKWSGLSDCPFVNQQLITEYKMLNETGWYRKMFQILLSTTSKAMKAGYPITAGELAALGRELDAQTGGWYKDRPLEAEAERAIAYACRSV